MKRSMCILICIMLTLTLLTPGFNFHVSASGQLQVITPYAAGGATGSGFFPMERAFDGQPTLDASETPTGGTGAYDAPYYSSRVGYIDFGPDWESVRITSTWTQYRVSSIGDQTPYAEIWWDDDKDTVNDSGLTEIRINFNTAQNLSTGQTTPWLLDSDVSSSPVAPQARYMLCRTPSNMTNRAKEYAIVGYIHVPGNEVTQIISPELAGVATGSAFFPLERAFDGQPVFDEVTGTPVGGSGAYDAPSYADRVGYIDFGEEWQKIRITSTWTQYRTSSNGNQTPYAQIWWDDDKDTVNDSGLTETRINFNSAQNLSTGSTTPWIMDNDVQDDPVIPEARYLMLRSPNPQTNRAKEYAIIGWIDENENGVQDKPLVQVTGITVTAAGGATSVLLDSTLQMSAEVIPYTATNKNYTWSVVNGTGSASINQNGLLTPLSKGKVTVKATAQDGSGVVGMLEITISEFSQFVLPVQGNESIYYNDIQASFPQVDWQNLDRLYIPAGHYNFMKLNNLPQRSSDKPLIITNYGGQVHIGGTYTYTVSLGGGSNWIFTGRYDPDLEIGHVNYQGHSNGNYANATGKYGIEVSDTNTTGLAVGGGTPTNYATNFEIEFVEIYRTGFAGLMIKTDNVPAATMDGVKVHDLYIHDTDAEGMYIGSTQAVEQQHKFTNFELYNNRVLRSGSEGIQLGQMGDNVNIHHNVVIMNSVFWKNAFNIWQDGGFQYSQRDGKGYVHDNIFIGGAGNTYLMQFFAASTDNVQPGDGTFVYNNYFGFGRNTLGYMKNDSSNYTSQFVFENNVISNYVYEYDEIDHPYHEGDTNTLWNVNDNKGNPLIIRNNIRDGAQIFISTVGGNNGTVDNVTATGNTTVSSIDPFIFRDTTFPANFDWRKVEVWHDYSDLYNCPIYYNYGDYAIEFSTGRLFKCILQGTHDARDYSLSSTQAWQLVNPMTDDFRLDSASPRQNMGLLDK